MFETITEHKGVYPFTFLPTDGQIGANDAIKQPQVIYAIANSLLSAHPPCRKVSAEILLFFALWEQHSADRLGLQIVLRAFEQLEANHNAQVGVTNKVSRFERWLRQTEEVVSSRGRMGSQVGATSTGVESNQLVDYTVSAPTQSDGMANPCR